MYISVFDKLIWHTIDPKSFCLTLHSSHFRPDGAVDYDYIVTNSLLIGSKCISNGATH